MGAVGGLLLFGAFFLAVTIIEGITPAILASAPVFVLAGAGSAAGTLALARKGEELELLGASAEVAEVGLTDGEVEELLGG